jgi:hypothetical protein
MKDLDGARRAFEDRRSVTAPSPPIEFWINGGWLARAQVDPVLLEDSLQAIRGLQADHPVLAELDQPIPISRASPPVH